MALGLAVLPVPTWDGTGRAGSLSVGAAATLLVLLCPVKSPASLFKALGAKIPSIPISSLGLTLGIVKTQTNRVGVI